jgi:sugar lactone lactonase YvrE
MGSDEEMTLPDGWAYEIIYQPTLSGLSGIVRSQSGNIYIRHFGSNGGVRVSQVDVDKDTLTTVLSFSKDKSAGSIVGGPGASFFITVDGKIRKVKPDGSYSVWGDFSSGYLFYYTPKGRMIGTENFTDLVEYLPDGSTQTLGSNFKFVYDVIGDDKGNIYVSDIYGGTITQIDQSNQKKVITNIAKDNTDLGFDKKGNLYINGVGPGFARINIENGEMTKIESENTPCRVIKTPSDFIFDNSGRTVFATWTDSSMSYYDIKKKEGNKLLHPTWANTFACEIGPDQNLYIAVSGCGSAISSKVVRFTLDGKINVFLKDIIGDIIDIALDPQGGLYFARTDESSLNLYYAASKNAKLKEIPLPEGIEITSITFNPQTGILMASGMHPPGNSKMMRIHEFSLEAGFLKTHQIKLPKRTTEFQIRSAPDGKLYAYASEEKRFTSGPRVNRWILRLNLDTGSAKVIARIDRIGCCPLGSFSIDHEGTMWWLLNPDFLLYKVRPNGKTSLFGKGMPVDASSANRNAEGVIFLNSPGGIYKLWEIDPAERIIALIQEIFNFKDQGKLSQKQAGSLTSKLNQAVRLIQQNKPNAAVSKLKRFITSVENFKSRSILSSQEAYFFKNAAQSIINQLKQSQH